MITVKGYSNLQIIHQSAQTLVYSARRHSDGEKVMLKQLRQEIASPEQVAQFRKEFELLQSLDSDRIIKPFDLIEQDNTAIIVMEDPRAPSLDRFLARQTFSMLDCVQICQRVVDGLDYLHANNIVHKNITPSTVLYPEASGQIKIIHFMFWFNLIFCCINFMFKIYHI